MTKIQKTVLLVLLAVVIILSAVFASVFMKVSSVKHNITATFDRQYEYRDGVLISGDNVMRFVTNMGTFRELEVGVFDFSAYSGAEDIETAVVTAYVDGNNLIPVTEGAMPYYNLDGCFVYGGDGEEKYLVDTEARTVVPLISRSSVNVSGISISGEFIFEIDGKDITILQRKDRNSNEIINERKVVIAEEFGNAEFIGWYNERFALVSLKDGISTRFIIIDGATAEYVSLVVTNDIPAFLAVDLEANDDPMLDGMVKCKSELVSDRYLQFYENIHDPMKNTYDQRLVGTYMDIFTSAVHNVQLPGEVFDGENKLISVSHDGKYALYKTAFTDDANGEVQYVVVNSENGKYYTVSEMIGDFAFIDGAYFIYNNILMVNFADMTTGVERACTVKLSF